MREKKYILYDDLRHVGTYRTLKECYDTGKIKQKKAYFYQKYAANGYYVKDNIFVYSMRDVDARCVFLAHTIYRWANTRSNTFKMNEVLSKAVKELTGQVL